ncbi:50S ribosomal protein L6 [Candidatus Roizmanbacteria bacterium RIFCSPLOWO2_02_FULL_38_10]|uniref:50S ribosomal protein L6 n=1 Tax=Candidatus Roizmanbacteria bacterium RIFCSPLOWO2_02_FULL_38_10 TaxID=1802074 RepID=A0A1F7JKA7_9BACT|nr:MAG: 50S ribosomal protein L6 [Candidatus Roizmanbacteria bacterium RIFCSPLOWO2_02_FULL_38_10]
MSKIGEMPVNIGESEVTIEGQHLTIKGPEGVLKLDVSKGISIEKQDETIVLKRNISDKKTKALHGLYRALIANAVIGVVKPWEKKLEIVGTGYRVKLQGEDLLFEVGYSHSVVFKKVAGIKFSVEGNNKVTVSGPDRQLVGQQAQKIKDIKHPDPYKGKGIRYEGERIKLKPGKKAKTAGAGVK